jgi:hypothetical protein
MIERKIIIALITSTEYCKSIKDIWDVNLLESSAAKMIASWSWEYYSTYDKAPEKQIELIYYDKLREGKLQKSLAEEIENDILPGLSVEAMKDPIDVKHLVTQTEKYLSEQHIKKFTGIVQALTESGRVEEANQTIQKFRPLDSVSNRIHPYIRTAQQIREQNKKQPTLLMKPWLREGETSIIYGNYGTGKTLLTLAVAYALGMHNYHDVDVGPWLVKNPTGTLYIDGELGELQMQERIACYEWLGKQSRNHKLQILSLPEFQLETGDTFFLGQRENQIKIIRWLKDHPSYKLIVLDSVSTLFGLQEENSNSEWSNKINPFLRDLRALGVANILLHHAGKDNKRGLRGASSMGAMAQNIFRLTVPKEKDMSQGEAWFTLTRDKQRGAGFTFKDFSLRFSLENNDTETHWEET